MSSILFLVVLGLGCPLRPPVPGGVVRPFAPLGAYGGHWGVDLAADEGSVVRAADFGVVTFAGPVAGRLSVTIHHGGGVRTSYSYLSTVLVSAGAPISSGDIVGTSGTHNGRPAVHYSLRVGNIYRAPPILRCVLIPADGLRLGGESVSSPYPRGRATRHSRRHIRSATLGPSAGWGGRASGT